MKEANKNTAIIDGNVYFYDMLLMNYNAEQWLDAVENLGIKDGDKLEIVIRKK